MVRGAAWRCLEAEKPLLDSGMDSKAALQFSNKPLPQRPRKTEESTKEMQKKQQKQIETGSFLALPWGLPCPSLLAKALEGAARPAPAQHPRLRLPHALSTSVLPLLPLLLLLIWDKRCLLRGCGSLC